MNQRKITLGTKKKEQTMAVALKRKPPMPPQQQRKRRRDQGKKKNDLHPNDIFKHWNKLPNDLLRVIMERVTLVDRIRIRTVCKDWLIPINGIPHHPFDMLPLMMAYGWKRTNKDQVQSLCELIDPFQNRKYIVEATNKRQERWQFVGAEARASRNGWVLFSNKEQDFFPVNGMLVFAFCPFTDEVVQLPEFVGECELAAFSTTPTLPDCVFFLVFAHGMRLEISTCRPGDKTWTRFVYDGNLSLELLDTNYADGNFYCIFKRGIVGAFNIMLQEWNILSNVEPKNFTLVNRHTKLVATREALLFVDYACMAWRFDLLRRKWKLIKEFENRTVFLGTTSFLIPAVGLLSEFSSKAYYFREYGRESGPIRVCDFKRSRHSFHSSIAMQNAWEMRIIWIEPPPSLCSS